MFDPWRNPESVSPYRKNRVLRSRRVGVPAKLVAHKEELDKPSAPAHKAGDLERKRGKSVEGEDSADSGNIEPMPKPPKKGRRRPFTTGEYVQLAAVKRELAEQKLKEAQAIAEKAFLIGELEKADRRRTRG